MATAIVPSLCLLCNEKVPALLTAPKRRLRYDLAAQDFGRLHVLHFLGMDKHDGALWCCLCTCDTPVIANSSRLVGNETRSCGCLKRDLARNNIQVNAQSVPQTTRYGDLVGQRFGRLVVQSLAYSKVNQRYWHCLCDCEERTIVTTGHLRCGDTASCGCLQRDRTSETHTTHGMNETTVYQRWCGMLRRCYNPHDKRFASYGGRGILVCESWRHSFENFYADMGDPPEGLTLERIDTDGNYSPDNCIWDTWQQQRINQRRTEYFVYNGKSRHLKEWSEIVGLPEKTVAYRVKRLGWDIALALTTPIRQLKRQLPL